MTEPFASLMLEDGIARRGFPRRRRGRNAPRPYNQRRHGTLITSLLEFATLAQLRLNTRALRFVRLEG